MPRVFAFGIRGGDQRASEKSIRRLEGSSIFPPFQRDGFREIAGIFRKRAYLSLVSVRAQDLTVRMIPAGVEPAFPT